jgi:hypothetical protein
MIVAYQTDLSTFIDGQAAEASDVMPKLGEMRGKSLRSIAMPLN